jgi:hypothetical protein
MLGGFPQVIVQLLQLALAVWLQGVAYGVERVHVAECIGEVCTVIVQIPTREFNDELLVVRAK